MPPLEFRSDFLFGLITLLVVWLVVVVIAKLLLAWMTSRASRYDNQDGLATLRHAREWFNSLMMPSLMVVCLCWALAFYMTGWVIPGSPDDPAGAIEAPEQPGALYKGDNNPEVRTNELREEGTELQQEQMRKLQEFRTEFFNNRKESETDETDH